MLVIGDKEAEASSVSVRTRSGGDMGAMSVENFIARITGEIKSRTRENG